MLKGLAVKPSGLYSKRLCLRHVGDVTVVLSQKRAERGPQAYKNPGDQSGRVDAGGRW